MRTFTTIIFSLSAALAAAQTSSQNGPNAFNIPAGQSSYNVAAGGTVDLSWSNQEGSTVTIKLQKSGTITPDSGVVLAQSITNTGSATVTIPSSADIPPGAYTFEIIDDANTSVYNFSPNFSVASASGTGSFGATASATGSVTSASASATTTSSASTTGSSASASSTSSSTSKSSAAASTTTSSAATTSSKTSQTTSAPNSNAGAKVQAPLAAAVMLGAAAFL